MNNSSLKIRFITKQIHAYLDYPVAISLMTVPFLLGLGQSHALAGWLAPLVGLAALVLTVFTDHSLGLIRVLPYRLHVAVDGLVGALFLLAPLALDFEGIDLIYYLVNGAAVAVVVCLQEPRGPQRV